MRVIHELYRADEHINTFHKGIFFIFLYFFEVPPEEFSILYSSGVGLFRAHTGANSGIYSAITLRPVKCERIKI